MNSIQQQLHEIEKLNQLQQRNQWMNRIHPLVKVLLSLFYILLTVSIDKYRIDLMLTMAIYPFMCLNLGELRLGDALWRLRLILPLVIFVGVFNPIFDRNAVLVFMGISVSGGTISMLNLMIKGINAVLAAYVLIAVTSIEDICYALRLLRVPRVIVIVILLINRYLSVLGEEADRIMTAYRLRAPQQKGLHYSVWGPLVGQWLMRSMDRAEILYESMTLRGFKGEFEPSGRHSSLTASLPYLLIWAGVLLALRFTPLIQVIGGLFQ